MNDAWRATQVAYSQRFVGMPVYKTFYRGSFPFQSVADACPLPSSAALKEHRACWSQLRKLFDEEWHQHRSAA